MEQHEKQQNSTCPNINLLSASIFGEKFGSQKWKAAYYLKYPLFFAWKLTEGKIIEIDLVFFNLYCFGSNVPVDEFTTVKFLQSKNNFAEVIEGDRKWENIVGLWYLSF